jgi:hypothetical protein
MQFLLACCVSVAPLSPFCRRYEFGTLGGTTIVNMILVGSQMVASSNSHQYNSSQGDRLKIKPYK